MRLTYNFLFHRQYIKQVMIKTNWPARGIHVNPLTPKSDQDLISPYSVTTESNIKIMRIEEMINNQRNSWFLRKFSFCVPWEIYRLQYGE